jgi:hypothetical protein
MQVQDVGSASAYTPIIPDEEGNTSDDENFLKEAVAVLVNSQNAMMEMRRNTNTHKVYIDKPDKFDGKVGDYIEDWLEQFETWFGYHEQVKGELENAHKIDTAIQTTAGDIGYQLSRYQGDYSYWEFWEAFAKHMRDTYGSKVLGFVKYICLKLTQQNKDSVDVFYSCFRRILEQQKHWMKNSNDNFIYNYVFEKLQ